MTISRPITALALALGLLAPLALRAQEGGHAGAAPALRSDAPPPPVAPATITRDSLGNATVRAFRISEPIKLDGRLDEAEYRDAEPITGFYQSLPDDGTPATERTEAWIMFDDENVYVAGRLYDSAPPEQWIANEMRRDTQQLRNNDTFTVQFDTYYDRRNGVLFYTNPLGARADIQFTGEGNPNTDWNPVWDVRTARFDGGWTVEMAIPFKSLRYRPGKDQVWGVQLRRAIRRKNEWVHLTHVPRSQVANGPQGIFRASRDATLVGIEAPQAGAKVEIKPYGISGIQTDRTITPAVSNQMQKDAGLDLKYGVTQNLTADATFRTDFAQVEADEQQVNLTRFELNFPEKRDFFLEGKGVYQFGLIAAGGGASASGNAPQLFFSRRIGLEGRNPVPIRGGGRLTGKMGSFDVGMMSIETGTADGVATPATNFSVLRVRHDLFSRSGLGVMFTNRSNATLGTGSNQTYGVDGAFSLFQDVGLSGYFARSRTDGLNGDDQSYSGTFAYGGDLVGLSLGHLRVGQNFDPEIGFLRRKGFRETMASARLSPRPRSIPHVRRIQLQETYDRLDLVPRGVLGDRQTQAQAQLELVSSDVVTVTYTDHYELLDQPFKIDARRNVTVPAGGYDYRDVQASLALGLQRWYSGTVAVQRGSFYDGNKTTTSLSTGRINVSDRISLEPTLSFNSVDLPEGSFTTDLAVTRVNYAFSPWMFFSGLMQYNTSTKSLSSNLRFRWEYRPGSELFVVYTDARSTDVPGHFTTLSTRGLTVKVTYLLRP